MFFNDHVYNVTFCQQSDATFLFQEYPLLALVYRFFAADVKRQYSLVLPRVHEL